MNKKESNKDEKTSSHIPYQDQNKNWDMISDPGGEKQQDKLEKDYQNFDKADQSLREDPGNANVMYPKNGKEFKNAEQSANEHNRMNGTDFKPEDQKKVTSKNVDDMQSHAVLDTASNTIYNSKPVNTTARSSERDRTNEFRKEGEKLTTPEKEGGASKSRIQNSAKEQAAQPTQDNVGEVQSSSQPVSRIQNKVADEKNTQQSPQTETQQTGSQTTDSQKTESPSRIQASVDQQNTESKASSESTQSSNTSSETNQNSNKGQSR